MYVFHFIAAAPAMALLYGWIGNWTLICQYLVVQLRKLCLASVYHGIHIRDKACIYFVKYPMLRKKVYFRGCSLLFHKVAK